MNLVMFDTSIRQDKEGRYCLNDLHKAAGGENRHRPSMWTENQQTKELIDELVTMDFGNAPAVSIRGGKNSGTYVCKELLLAYSIWLNNKVFLKLAQALTDFAIIQEALNNFEVPDDLPDMYVYAIKNTDTGNIKLGISKNPAQRLKQLQTGCDGKLELVAYKKAENGYQDESKLHHDNDQHLIHGEWFTEEAKFN